MTTVGLSGVRGIIVHFMWISTRLKLDLVDVF